MKWPHPASGIYTPTDLDFSTFLLAPWQLFIQPVWKYFLLFWDDFVLLLTKGCYVNCSLTSWLPFKRKKKCLESEQTVLKSSFLHCFRDTFKPGNEVSVGLRVWLLRLVNFPCLVAGNSVEHPVVDMCLSTESWSETTNLCQNTQVEIWAQLNLQLGVKRFCHMSPVPSSFQHLVSFSLWIL